MFWGSAQLRERLPDGRVEPFHKDRIDGASYRLSIGSEIYVSPTADATDASTRSITRLKEAEAFAIPPGQFAFLLTDERVKVDLQELAFISIRAKTKYRGLVNVSGFHVDPGFHGRLTFAVHNAGPVPIHLRQGDDIFLIWYADLESACEEPREPGPYQIQSEWIGGVSGRLHSLASLAARLDAVTRELLIFRTVAVFAVTLLLTIGGIVFKLLPNVQLGYPSPAVPVSERPEPGPQRSTSDSLPGGQSSPTNPRASSLTPAPTALRPPAGTPP